MSHFIVERFVPGATADDVRAWGVAIEASIEALELGGEVSHLGSELMNRDETCLCFFEAAETGSIHRVNDHAEVPKRKDGDFVKVASKDVLLDEFSSYLAKFDRPNAERCRIKVRFPGDADHLPSTTFRTFDC